MPTLTYNLFDLMVII